MRDWSWLGATWELLGRDMALVGGFQSPLLSWLGAGGIVFLCLWHSLVLSHGTWQIRQTLARLHPTVFRLASARRQASHDWIVLPLVAKKQRQQAQVQGARRDLDDLHKLKLSQDRSFAALVKGLEIIRARLPWAYECFQQKTSASGCGRQDLLRHVTGQTDRDGSRRVIFKFHLRHT